MTEVTVSVKKIHISVIEIKFFIFLFLTAPPSESLNQKNSVTPSNGQSNANPLTLEETMDKLRQLFTEMQVKYKQLQNYATYGLEEKPFTSAKTVGLWKLAQANNFTPIELEDIRGELMHYEMQLHKLRLIEEEFARANSNYQNKVNVVILFVKSRDENKIFFFYFIQDKLKLPEVEEKIQKYARKIEKLQEEIERRIFLHAHDEL